MPLTCVRYISLGCIAQIFWAVPAAAQDEDKTQCAAAYERAQEDRAASHLKSARDDLVICAQQTCPSFVQTDCVQWLAEVEAEMPSVVVAAKASDGSDTVDVKVTVDGEVFAEQLDGKTKDIDPGMHVFRFEHADAEPIERQILIRQGEKNRIVEVSFAPTEPPAREEPTPAPSPKTPEVVEEPPPASPGPLRPYAFVAGGVGALGLLSFGVFGLLGRSEQSHLEDTCNPNCTDDQIAPVRTKYLIADISLAVGVAGLATGVVLYVLSEPQSKSPEADTSAIRVDAQARRGGAFATVSGVF